ncbi:hypothetical protein RS030_81319 [Cryptosporidium xiaoi]|uniref:Uncharacterized protein n=1 Tax=Cryptosporidium xiaoi TaxID=659607 RepID=A0AAV9XWE4_9CRYT
MVINTKDYKETDSGIRNLVSKVSNIIKNTGKYEDNIFNTHSNETIGANNSNSIEDPEMIGKVWSNRKLNMKSTISSLVSNLAGSFDCRDAENQVKMLEGRIKNKSKLTYFASPNKQLEMERRVQYDSIQKGMKRWGKIIDSINRQEIISYGEAEKTDILSVSQLSNNYEPIDEFEREFERVLLEVSDGSVPINPKDTKNHGNVLPCNKIRCQIESNFVKKLKFILFNQQKENKRLKKIKSKSWRKNRRMQIQIEEEKLISLGEMEYPELVKNIKEKYEKRRAKIRLMRRQFARQKWAKMATRFGGKEIQRSISNQAQMHHDEKKRIEQIIGNFSSDVESDNGNDHEKGISEYIEDSFAKVSELKSVSKGLTDLKFIQRGIDYANEELELKLKQFKKNTNYENDSNAIDAVPPQVELKKPTLIELNDAENEIVDKMRVENFSGLDISLFNNGISELKNKGIPINEVKKTNNRSESETNYEFDIRRHNFNIQDELEMMAQEDINGDHSSDNSNMNTIKEVFVQGNDKTPPHESVENKTDTEKAHNKKATIPGWGSWCLSLSGVKEGENEENTSNKERPRIKQNKRVDRKIASYCVNKIPHPFNSNDLYESTLKHPIGPEWNTTSIHNKLIQPKIQSRMGAVIKPLLYSKRLKNINISDSFLKKWNDAKKCNRTKARF